MIYAVGYSVVVLVFWAICGVGAYMIAASKNRSGCG
jgi:hypothetical protein